MMTPEIELSAMLADAQNFWVGRSADATAFDHVMQGKGKFPALCLACGFHPEEVVDGLIRWLECHTGPVDAE